jgi:hypothetical protein
MTKSPKAKTTAAPTIDKSIHISNCTISNLDRERMTAIEALARAAEANADAILEIAKGVSAGSAIGIMVKTEPA